MFIMYLISPFTHTAVDSMDQVDPVDPVDPVDQVDPVDPVDTDVMSFLKKNESSNA